MTLVVNAAGLGTTPARRDALDIVEAGLAAVDTVAAVRRQVSLHGDIMTVAGRSWDLSRFGHVHLIGFGKASCAAAAALEDILGPRLYRGIALGTAEGVCRTIDTCEATHPLPSERNAQLSERLVKQCEEVKPEDLVLVIVSGGGSAMLCWPASECEQGVRLYHAANRTGITIHELNTVRKHLSALKGGGLAKLLAPATVVGLVFSDVPGGRADMVASGPTYPDQSTIADAQAVIERYRLGQFELVETPKDSGLFTNVTNIVLVSNGDALEAMADRARSLGYVPNIIGDDRYEDAAKLIAAMQDIARPGTVVLAGGEPMLVVPADHGTGGRNQHTALVAATMLQEDQVFASVASDGRDNGPHAGALVDTGTAGSIRDADMDISEHVRRVDDTRPLERSGSLLETGPTGTNVSDLIMLLTPKENSS